jgi:hypothetical protein
MIEYETCANVIRKCKQSSLRFCHWLSRRKRLSGIDFDSLMVMPVQRTTRHKLLLEKLLQKTDVAHGEYDILLEAVECLKDLANYQNECIRTVNNLKQVQELSKLLKITNLAEPQRRIVLEGSAYLKDVEHNVYLFSDALFLRNNKAITFYQLKSMCIIGGTKYSIAISYGSNYCELFFDHYHEKLKWLDHLEKQIQTSRKDYHEPRFIRERVSLLQLVRTRVLLLWNPSWIGNSERVASPPGSIQSL